MKGLEYRKYALVALSIVGSAILLTACGGEQPVEQEEHAVRGSTQHIAALQLELIRNRLQHKAQQYEHPHPIRPAETRAVKQRE